VLSHGVDFGFLGTLIITVCGRVPSPGMIRAPTSSAQIDRFERFYDPSIPFQADPASSPTQAGNRKTPRKNHEIATYAQLVPQERQYLMINIRFRPKKAPSKNERLERFSGLTTDGKCDRICRAKKPVFDRYEDGP
jgi:hypothetical protein